MAVSPIQLNSVNVDQDISRLYESSTTTLPGMALASTNAVATLPSIGSSFRVRVGIKNTSPAGNTILGSSLKLRAQYAKKGAATTCSTVPDSSWQNVTASSSLAYASTGPANGTAISAYSDDPVLPSITDKYSYQSIVRVTGADSLTFTNNNSIKHPVRLSACKRQVFERERFAFFHFEKRSGNDASPCLSQSCQATQRCIPQ